MAHVFLAVVIAAASPAAHPAPVPSLAHTQEQPARASAAPQVADVRAEAYYQFILGRRLDGDGDTKGAIAAYTRALELDPGSAEIHAELATLYARQNDLGLATASAEAALKNDPDNAEAHRLLGMISAERAERDDETGAADPATQEAARDAIGHLEKALKGSRLEAASGIRLALGRLYLQTRQADHATAVLKQVLVDEPGLPQAITLLAQAYSGAGQGAAAIDLLKDAVQQDPSFYASLAEAYEKDRRWAEAAEAYRQASAFNPRDSDLKTHWALALLNTDDESQARRARDLLLDVTRSNPASGWPLYLLSRAQRETGDLAAAEQTARRMLAVSPTSVSGAHALAQVLAERRDFGGVVEALAPMVARMPKGRDADQALLLTHLGLAYLETHRLSESVASFERARTLNPEDPSLPLYLGQALNTSKRFDDALALVRPLRDAHPADVRLARVEADALRGQGHLDQGAAVLKALADGPAASAETAQALGEYFAAAHQYAAAAAVLEPALRTYPDDWDLRFQYGAMLERQKQTSAAERVFREVIAADPRHAPALNYLGYMLADRGERLPEALALIRRAVDLEPYNGAYLDSLGWALFRMGKLDEAETHLRAAANQLPRDSAVQDHWGDLLARRGRLDQAVVAWKAALAGDGESTDRAAVERKIKDALDKRRQVP